MTDAGTTRTNKSNPTKQREIFGSDRRLRQRPYDYCQRAKLDLNGCFEASWLNRQHRTIQLAQSLFGRVTN